MPHSVIPLWSPYPLAYDTDNFFPASQTSNILEGMLPTVTRSLVNSDFSANIKDCEVNVRRLM